MLIVVGEGVHIRRVGAAVAMLVLLGVPWVTTAFGALNSNEDGMDAFLLACQVSIFY